MKLTKLLTEINKDTQWNIDYIFNDLQARVNRAPGSPNYGLKGIVEVVRQEIFPYKQGGVKKYGIMVWFYPGIDDEQIKKTAQFIKNIHGDMFRKYGFSMKINNKLLKILLSEKEDQNV